MPSCSRSSTCEGQRCWYLNPARLAGSRAWAGKRDWKEFSPAQVMKHCGWVCTGGGCLETALYSMEVGWHRQSLKLGLFISLSPVQLPEHHVCVTLLSPKSATRFCRTQVIIKIASASQVVFKASGAILGLCRPLWTFQQSHKVGKLLFPFYRWKNWDLEKINAWSHNTSMCQKLAESVHKTRVYIEYAFPRLYTPLYTDMFLCSWIFFFFCHRPHP